MDLRELMDWHFDPATGSPFWVRRARSLDFDPRADIKDFADLALFPNVASEWRTVRAEDLVPRGCGELVGVFESGGTTGVPKRVVCTQEWTDLSEPWVHERYDEHGVPRGINWLGINPTGPHVFGDLSTRRAKARGGLNFAIDMDPRWVKRLIADGRFNEADAYAEHLVDQAETVLRTQDIGGLICTPAMLERLCRRDELVELLREKVRAILWAGTHMDADSRHLYRTEVFGDAVLCGAYGSTMILGAAIERPGLAAGSPCVFDGFSPYITYSVIDPVTGCPVGYGERGQVVMHHVSRSMLLPNNLERDLATRVEPLPGVVGDAVADVAPVETFEDGAVIEGVY